MMHFLRQMDRIIALKIEINTCLPNNCFLQNSLELHENILRFLEKNPSKFVLVKFARKYNIANPEKKFLHSSSIFLQYVFASH